MSARTCTYSRLKPAVLGFGLSFRQQGDDGASAAWLSRSCPPPALLPLHPWPGSGLPPAQLPLPQKERCDIVPARPPRPGPSLLVDLCSLRGATPHGCPQLRALALPSLVGAGACLEVAFPRPSAVPRARELIVDLPCPQTSGLAAQGALVLSGACLSNGVTFPRSVSCTCPGRLLAWVGSVAGCGSAAGGPSGARASRRPSLWGARLPSSLPAGPRPGVCIRPRGRPRPHRRQVDAELRGCDAAPVGVAAEPCLPSLACPSGHALRGRSRSQAQWDAEGTCPTRKPRSGPGSAH